MKKRLRNILSSKVHPVFFALCCLLLMAVVAAAQVCVQEIMRVNDEGLPFIGPAILKR